MGDLEALREKLRCFVAARDWAQFHSPKNLAMALGGEAGELLEVFQWLTETDSKALKPAQRDAAAMEIADVFLYLVMLADALDLDLLEVANRKLDLNEGRYPADKVRGSAKKHTEY
ncbi:MAG: nucleotide pyrophosphohydrolase [Pseudomonadales bacterium]|nr:nucleotide pyrophosphohydrolase [Pseudomonadales bacterium]